MTNKKELAASEHSKNTNNQAEVVPRQGISIICEKNKKYIKHSDITYYKNTYGEKINDYFKFTIVRKPYDRILSFYFYSKGKNNQKFNINMVSKGGKGKAKGKAHRPK